MADNVAITPGTGTSIATDDVGGVQYQRVKPSFGVDGTAADVSSVNPLPVTVDSGTLLNRLELLELALRALLAGAGAQPHDGQGRTRVTLEALPVGSVTVAFGTAALQTVTNVGAWGGYALTPAVPALMNGGFDALRRGITVT